MARKFDAGYYISEGVHSIFTHGFMSFAAVCMIVACLLIMGSFSLVALNLNGMLQELEDENEFLAYVDDSYDDQQARALEATLEAIPNVASATFITKEEALESFTADYPEEALFQNLDPEILRDRYAIRVVELELQGSTVTAIENGRIISDETGGYYNGEKI